LLRKIRGYRGQKTCSIASGISIPVFVESILAESQPG
jgi:hypothetical protein